MEDGFLDWNLTPGWPEERCQVSLTQAVCECNIFTHNTHVTPPHTHPNWREGSRLFCHFSKSFSCTSNLGLITPHCKRGFHYKLKNFIDLHICDPSSLPEGLYQVLWHTLCYPQLPAGTLTPSTALPWLPQPHSLLPSSTASNCCWSYTIHIMPTPGGPQKHAGTSAKFLELVRDILPPTIIHS